MADGNLSIHSELPAENLSSGSRSLKTSNNTTALKGFHQMSMFCNSSDLDRKVIGTPHLFWKKRFVGLLGTMWSTVT